MLSAWTPDAYFCPTAMTVDTSNEHLFVGGYALPITGWQTSGVVLVVDIVSSTVIAAVDLGADNSVASLAINSQNGHVFVLGSSWSSPLLTVIDATTNSIISTTGQGSGVSPRYGGLVFDSLNGDLYVTGPNGVSVYSDSAGEWVARINTPYEVMNPSFDPTNGYIYMATNYEGYISVIDGSTNTLVATFPTPASTTLNSLGLVDSHVYATAFNPNNGYLYATSNTYEPSNSGYDVWVNNKVFVIDPTTYATVSSVDVGRIPWYLAFNPLNGDVYVACVLDGVYVVKPGIPIVSVSGDSVVPTGTSATVTVLVTNNNGQPIGGAPVAITASPEGPTISPAAATTSAEGEAVFAIVASVPGIYTLSSSVSGATETWTLVVYDPNGNAAGGGWYYPLDDLNNPLPGKATFGFVAQYQKGQAQGNLEFQFHDSGINLESTSITWLVVSESSAQFKGTAIVNGDSGYHFRVMAHDGGSQGTDTFAIKIWLGDPDAGGTLIHSSHNILGGGNVIVRTK